MLKQTNKLTEREIRFVVSRGRVEGKGSWIKVVKKYRLPV